MKERMLIALVIVLALGVIIMGYAQAGPVVVGELGCFDDAYKWYSPCDAAHGMITTAPDHIVGSGQTWYFEFDYDPAFKSVMIGTSAQHTTFAADLRGGAVLTISWSPGYSAWEQLEATLDANTLVGRSILAGSDNSQTDARVGAGEPGRPLWYFTEVFEFPPLTDGSHTLTIRSLDGNGVGFDYIKLEALVLQVAIDIKPGSDPNCFNNNGHGVIPVAILGSADFDVSQIDPGTVALEGLAIRAVGKSNKLLAHIEDVNGDGIDDLVVQIEDTDGAFVNGNGTAAVTGNLKAEFEGIPFEGTDSICIRPPE